jgi:hypothetical protein
MSLLLSKNFGNGRGTPLNCSALATVDGFCRLRLEERYERYQKSGS